MAHENESSRREFLVQLATVAGGAVLVPAVSVVSPAQAQDSKPTSKPTSKPKLAPIPTSRPKRWNAIAYNKKRGNAGAIPKSYHASINGKDGDKKHLGKHLPYQPKFEAKLVPAGYLAIMWGDPAKGYAKHPNAPKTNANPEGHWYNWIKVRKATDGKAQELKSEYSDWPGTKEGDSGKYAVFGGGEITADGGKNTVYLAALPKDVKKGDTIRIHAHCLTHGEYVDFLTVS